MAIDLISTIHPKNNGAFPTHDSEFGLGGWREVPDAATRDAISVGRRRAGMVAYVQNEQQAYVLDADLTTWTDFDLGGGGSPQGVVFVAKNGDPVEGDGSFGNPYLSITQALQAAPTNYIVMVCTPALYEESITLGSKNVALYLPVGTTIDGYLALQGSGNVTVQGGSWNFGGTGGTLRARQVGGKVTIANATFPGTSAQEVMRITDSDGAWAGGSLELINTNLTSGKVNIEVTANVTFKNLFGGDSIIEVNRGSLSIEKCYGLQRVDHFGGSVALRGMRALGVSAFAPAVNSTADTGLLVLENVDTWVTLTGQSYIQKTGSCQYVVSHLSRNPAKDIFNGVRTGGRLEYTDDVGVNYLGVNYTGALNASASTHLAGIDTALSLRLKAIVSIGAGYSLIGNGALGQVKSLVTNPGLRITEQSNTLTLINDGVVDLTTAGGTGSESLVYNAKGQLMALEAGDGMTLVRTGTTIRLSSSAVAGVTSVNGRTGAVILKGTGLTTITEAGTTVTIDTQGVAALSTVAGGSSLVSTATGRLKAVRPGPGIKIEELTAGVYTFSQDNATATGVSSVNGKTGAVVVSQGAGISLTPTPTGFQIAGSGVTALSGPTGAGIIPLFQLPSGVMMGLKAGANIDLNPAGGVIEVSTTIPSEIVETVNARTGNIVIEGSGATTVTTDANGKITVSSAGGTAAVSSVNDLAGAVKIEGEKGITVSTDSASGTVTVGFGASPGDNILTKVESAGAGTSLVADDGAATGVAQIKSLTVEGLDVEATADGVKLISKPMVSVKSEVEAGTVSVVSDDGETSREAKLLPLKAGLNVAVTKVGNAVEITAVNGGGTVKSVNGKTVNNPIDGAVTLTPADVDAYPETGGAILGDINMNGFNIQNVLDPTELLQPVNVQTLQQTAIDMGTF